MVVAREACYSIPVFRSKNSLYVCVDSACVCRCMVASLDLSECTNTVRQQAGKAGRDEKVIGESDAVGYKSQEPKCHQSMHELPEKLQLAELTKAGTRSNLLCKRQSTDSLNTPACYKNIELLNIVVLAVVRCFCLFVFFRSPRIEFEFGV